MATATKALKLTWFDDLKAESDLRRMAVSFDRVKIPFNQLDLKESQVNGARMHDAIVVRKVEDYMQGFLNGDTFPRGIVHKTPTGYVILSGNQRMKAIQNLIADGVLPKNVEVEMYLVDTTDKFLLEIIARSANVSHGEGPAKDERLHHAIYCVRSLGMRVADASKQFVVSKSSIQNNMNAEDQRKQLAAAGIDSRKIPSATLEPLAKLNFDAPAKERLGHLIAQHGPPSERVRQVVGTMTKQTTAPARLKIIKDFEHELSLAAHESNGHSRNGHANSAATKVPLRPRRDKLIRLLSSLSNFLDSENGGESFTSLDELQVASEADRTRVIDLCKKLTYRLRVIAK